MASHSFSKDWWKPYGLRNGDWEEIHRKGGHVWRKSFGRQTAFRPGIWLGKTDRADFNIVATVDGLRWTRTIRRLPIAYDAETLANVRTSLTAN